MKNQNSNPRADLNSNSRSPNGGSNSKNAKSKGSKQKIILFVGLCIGLTFGFLFFEQRAFLESSTFSAKLSSIFSQKSVFKSKAGKESLSFDDLDPALVPLVREVGGLIQSPELMNQKINNLSSERAKSFIQICAGSSLAGGNVAGVQAQEASQAAGKSMSTQLESPSKRDWWHRLFPMERVRLCQCMGILWNDAYDGEPRLTNPQWDTLTKLYSPWPDSKKESKAFQKRLDLENSYASKSEWAGLAGEDNRIQEACSLAVCGSNFQMDPKSTRCKEFLAPK